MEVSRWSIARIIAPGCDWDNDKTGPFKEQVLAKADAILALGSFPAPSDDAVERLRELSKRAEPREWTTSIRADGKAVVMEGLSREIAPCWGIRGKSNAEFIAACVNFVRAALTGSEGG